MSYPYTVSFDLKLTGEDGTANTKESSLFSGYDGRIQVAGHDGKMSADVNYFTRDFNYKVPTDGTPVKVTIVGTFQATRLYVNGQLVTFLSQKADQDGLAPDAISTMYSSVLLPLEKIGQDFHGQMANLKVYNKALSAAEVAGNADDGLVNVAQNTAAGSNSYASGDSYDDGEQRTSIAMKAIDGEAFTTSDDNSSEIYSYWQGDHADSALTVDLGQARTISQVEIQWRSNGVGKDFQILTSMDGENWDVAAQVADNREARETITLETPVSARYVKLQGIASNNGTVYKVQEFLVYEAVDKTALNDLLAKAEEIVAQKGLGFTSTGLEGDLFQAVVYAHALSTSPLATIEEVTAAVAALEEAMQALENETIPSASYAITVEASDNGTVTASRTRAPKGLTVTLTVKPDEGYKLDTITVTDKNGNEIKLTDKGNGKYTFTMPASAVTVEASFTKDDGSVSTGLPFTDVKADDWFYEAVKYVYDNKLMDGTSATTFAPLMTTNRAMIVTILWRLEGQPETDATLSFTDVESGVWYTDAVNWAASKGIVKGYSDTVFAPNDTVTREQLATILYRYAEYKEYDVSAKGDLTTFADGAKTSSWAAEAMEWAVGSSLLSGKDGGKLDPTGTATRAEVATILMRFMESEK